MVSSAQSLRITRKLWKVGKRQEQWELSLPALHHISSIKDENGSNEDQPDEFRQISHAQFMEIP
jgi:hypothetical protein